MKVYTKVISIQGSYFIKEYKKTKNHGDKKRAIQEDTVAKVFKEEDTTIVIIFEEQNKTIELTNLSSAEDIKKYLGNKFL